MLGLLVVIGAAFSVRRLWPGGIVFLLIWPLIAVPIQMLMRARARASFGETVDWSIQSLVLNYAASAAASAVVFLIAFAVRGFIQNRRDKQAANR